jgi:hypothetical protein
VGWLDEAQRFLNGQHGGDVARALHLMLDWAPQPDPKRVVIGSSWPPKLWLSPDDDDGQVFRNLLARRIGFWSPLPVAMLAEAASGYRRSRQGPPEVDLAVADAMEPVCGVRALTRAEGHEHGAVILHRYLAQHAREARRGEAIPDSLWAAVTSVVDDVDDSKRVFDSTLHRGLLRPCRR